MSSEVMETHVGVCVTAKKSLSQSCLLFSKVLLETVDFRKNNMQASGFHM